MNNKASILGTTLIVLGMVLAIAIGVSTVSVQERRSSIGSNQSITAYQNADTGIEKILNEITRRRLPSDSITQISIAGASCNSSSGQIEESGKFNITLKDSSGNQIDCDDNTEIVSSISSIQSTGLSPLENRSIEVALAQAGGNVVAGGTCINGINGLWSFFSDLYGGAVCGPLYYAQNFNINCPSNAVATVICPSGTTKVVVSRLNNCGIGGEGVICLQ